MKFKFLVLAALLSVAGYSEQVPWAATQRLEDITGLKLPRNYRNLARWKTDYAVAVSDLPEYWDWRFYANGLPPVKRQRYNDCWAQGTVGVLESLVKIQLNKEVDLSVQQVLPQIKYYASACTKPSITSSISASFCLTRRRRLPVCSAWISASSS